MAKKTAIGIDLGTSNSACSVWDSSRGGAKWVRLSGVTEPLGTKAGRIMPSVVRFNNDKEEPLVGHPALLTSLETSNDKNKSSLLRSVKRLLGKKFQDLDPAWIETLDFDVQTPSENDDGPDESLLLVARTNSASNSIAVTPEQVLAIELEAIRKACQAYLDRYRLSKNLRVPGGGDEVGGIADGVNQNKSLDDGNSNPVIKKRGCWGACSLLPTPHWLGERGLPRGWVSRARWYVFGIHRGSHRVWINTARTKQGIVQRVHTKRQSKNTKRRTYHHGRRHGRRDDRHHNR